MKSANPYLKENTRKKMWWKFCETIFETTPYFNFLKNQSPSEKAAKICKNEGKYDQMYKRFFADFPAHLFTRVFFQILFCGFLWIKFILWIEIASNNYDKKSANPFKRKSVNEKDLMKNLRKHCLPFQIQITSNLYNLNKSLFFISFDLFEHTLKYLYYENCYQQWQEIL